MPGSSPAEPTGVRILLVEDEVAIRRATAGALEAMGHTVDAEGELEAAQAQLKAHTYDLAILDLKLRQGCGGFVLIRHIRAAGLPTPIVILSSTRDHEDILAALRLGVSDFVQKPVRVSELQCVTRRILQRGAVAANEKDAAALADEEADDDAPLGDVAAAAASAEEGAA